MHMLALARRAASACACRRIACATDEESSHYLRRTSRRHLLPNLQKPDKQISPAYHAAAASP